MSDQQTAAEAIKARLRTLTGPARSGGTKDMAELLGLPFDNVTRWVHGRVIPPHEFLMAVAERYKVTLDWLYARSDTGGLAEAQAMEPPWARRLDARLSFLERKIDALSAAPRLEVTDELLSQFLAVAEERRSSGADEGTEEPAADEAPASQDAPTGAGAR